MCKRVCDGFLFYTFILALFVSQFALIIHSGICWNQLKLFSYLNKIDGNVIHKLPLLFLLTMIFGIIVPIIAPLVTGSLIIHNTSSDKCEIGKSEFISQILKVCKNDSPQENDYNLYNHFKESLYKNHVFNCSDEFWTQSKWFNDWFYDRCNKIHMFYWIWIGLRIFCFGGIILVVLVAFLIALIPKRYGTRRVYDQII